MQRALADNAVVLAEFELSEHILLDIDKLLALCFYISRVRCRDYVRLFLDLERPEVAETQRPNVELCGSLSGRQRRFYSSKRSLVVELHTDNWQSNSTGFSASYRFVDKCTRR